MLYNLKLQLKSQVTCLPKWSATTSLRQRSMPVPNLKARNVFHIVCFALYQLGRSIALNPRRFPSGRTAVNTGENEAE
jgi:hypothetical protein